ncbi:hypothetical protein LTR17_001197 [Elasticomyces elasticus]|nr:hypothetical protein LTR17_001197 [Elasticomyces elasticus]
MPARKAPTAKRPVVQDSSLLDLPPELRNAIYEYIVSNTRDVSYCESILLYTPAFGKVCRQLRNEYEGIYRRGAPRFAKAATVHMKGPDFDASGSLYDAARRILDVQCPTEQPWFPLKPVLKILRVCVAFRGTLKSHLWEMRDMPSRVADLNPRRNRSTLIPTTFRIFLDKTSFHLDFSTEPWQEDVWYLVLRSSGKKVSSSDRCGRYPKILKAWQEACDIYCSHRSMRICPRMIPGRDRLLQGFEVDLNRLCKVVDQVLHR